MLESPVLLTRRRTRLLKKRFRDRVTKILLSHLNSIGAEDFLRKLSEEVSGKNFQTTLLNYLLFHKGIHCNRMMNKSLILLKQYGKALELVEPDTVDNIKMKECGIHK